MKLTARQDIEAPADFVLGQLADFESWERAAMRRGAEVSRIDSLARPGPGMIWQARFRYRGRDRDVTVRLDRIEADGTMGFTASSPQAEGVITVEIVAMAARHSRMFMAVDIVPRSFTAKLVVQSLKLARARVDRSFRQRARKFADEIEARWRRAGRK